MPLTSRDKTRLSPLACQSKLERKGIRQTQTVKGKFTDLLTYESVKI